MNIVAFIASLAVFVNAQITLDFNCTDGTAFIGSATSCDNKYDDATCALFFTTAAAPGGTTRDTKCNEVTAGTFSQDAKDFAVATCPKQCGYCCQTPEYNCDNKDYPRVRCETVTKAQCSDTTWRPILAEDCPNVCGFCLAGGCVDTVVQCANDPAICRQMDMQDFVKINCQRTCGYCPTSTTVSGITVTATSATTAAGSSNTVASCVDSHPSCQSWTRNGFCTSTFYNAATKRKHCPRTCNLC